MSMIEWEGCRVHPSETKAVIKALVLFVVLFHGEPDLMGAIINLIGRIGV